MRAMQRRVVITGCGIVSPLGCSLDGFWDSLLKGRSGVSRISCCDVSDLPTQIGAEVEGFDPSTFLSPQDIRRYDTSVHYGMGAALMAHEDASLATAKIDKSRCGVLLSSAVGGPGSTEQNHEALLNSGPRRVSPFYLPSSLVNTLSGMVSIELGYGGPNLAAISACATGTHSIGLAARMIGHGDADLMLAGGADMTQTRLLMTAFCNMKALSRRNDEPEAASRPWDKGRDGFVMGAGAAALVLESLDVAQARGAKIYGEVVGFGMSSDAHHMTSPSEDGSGAALSMNNALADAEIQPDRVDYINAHGTSTPLGDLAETRAIKKVFGSHAHSLAVNSSKSMLGHMMGAAGAAEAITCLLSLQEQRLHPTINVQDPDDECDLDYVTEGSREHTLEHALSNSFGFGSSNATLVFKRYEQE